MNKTLKQIIKSNFLSIIIGLLLVMGILYGYFTISMNSLENKSVILQNGALKNTHTVFELRIAVIQTQQFLSDVSATRAAPGFDDGFKKAEEWNQTFHDNIKKLKSSVKDKNILSKLNQLEETYNTFYSQGVEMAKIYVKDGPEKGNLIMEKFDKIANQMYSELQQVEKEISEPVFLNFKDLYNSIVLINNIILYGFGSVFILFLIYCGFKLKQLLGSVNKIIDTLSKIVLELVGSSKQSEADNENVQKYTDLQMKSLEETTEATIEIDQMVESNKKSAFTLMEKANEVERLSNEGLELLNNVYKGSIEQRDNSKKLKEELATNLKKFSAVNNLMEEIKTKTKLINDIVFQTKLLSFNAQIEAARAGDAGRGFSVVAEEVGKLAILSNEAAQSINEIISKSIIEIDTTVSSVDQNISIIANQTLDEAEKSNDRIVLCKESYDKILENLKELHSQVEMVSSSTEQQSVALTLLNQRTGELEKSSDISKMITIQSIKNSQDLISNIDLLVEAVSKIDKFNYTVEKLPWNDSLLLNIKEMDDEHKLIFEKINLVIDSIAQDSNVSENMQLLMDVTRKHFSDEEELMEQMKYKKRVSHKQIHENMLKKLDEYANQIDKKQCNYNQLIAFLKNWLYTHIMSIDTQYSSEYNSN